MKANTLYTIKTQNGAQAHIGAEVATDGLTAVIDMATLAELLEGASGDKKYIVSATTLNMPQIGDGLDEIRKESMQMIIDKAMGITAEQGAPVPAPAAETTAQETTDGTVNPVMAAAAAAEAETDGKKTK